MVNVTYKINNEHIFIGSYDVYNYGMTREWMKYNTETIAIAKQNLSGCCADGVQIKVIFNIKTRLFVEGSKEDLLEYYNQQFINKKQGYY